MPKKQLPPKEKNGAEGGDTTREKPAKMLLGEEKEEVKVILSEKSDFRVGDTVDVTFKLHETGKSRNAHFKGIVIAKKGAGVGKTVTVRRIASTGVGVERIFPINSPNVTSLKVLKRGKVRRAKLYYLRKRIGKAAVKVKERKKD